MRLLRALLEVGRGARNTDLVKSAGNPIMRGFVTPPVKPWLHGAPKPVSPLNGLSHLVRPHINAHKLPIPPPFPAAEIMTKTKTLPPPFDNPAYTVALIGYGSLAKKTAAGLRRAGFKGRILVTGRDQEKLRRNADLYNVECVSNEEAANQADLVIVSTKANVLLNMVSSIRQCFLERPHVPIISFAAALRVDDIRRALEQDGNGTPVIRAMPTTLVATASESPIAIYIPPDDAQKCEPLIKAFFQMLGTPIFLDEEKKIPSAVAVACSPAFTWKIMLSMEQALLEEGWKETDARIAIATMMKSAADLVLENPEIDLNNAICAVATKGGFTERELKRMEKLKVFTAFKEAYAAVTEGCETLSDELSLDVEASKYRATLLGKTSP